MPATLTRKDAVLKLMRPRRWVSSYDIIQVGGTEGMRRLRELRAEGYEFKTQPAGNGTFKYRLVGTP